MRRSGLQSILVIKLRYIGDVVLSTPVLTRLHVAFPTARITILLNAGTEEVVRGHPALDEVLIVQRRGIVRQWRLLKELRRRRFDLVVDLTDGDRSAILTWLSGAPVRLGYNSEHRWRGRLYSRLVQADPCRMHRVRYHLAATEALELSGPAPPPSIAIAPDAGHIAQLLFKDLQIEADRPVVCLHPGARWWFKAWPVERFAELADRIQTETEAQTVFLGGEQDRQVVQCIRAQMKTPHRSLAAKTGLQVLAAVLERAVLMITNDNGPMHLAAAVGTRVVGLFGPSDPVVWGPWGTGHRTFYKQLDCRACFHPDCFRGEQNCMRLISVDEVWQAVRALLQEPACQTN
jgi:heptosyltransferase-3